MRAYSFSYTYTDKNDGRTPLHVACAKGHKELVEFLLNDAEVNRSSYICVCV